MAITIVGLGPGNPDLLTREAWEILSQAGEVYLRTGQHPTVGGLPANLTVRSFDAQGGRYVPNALAAGYAAAIGATGEPGSLIAPFPWVPLASLREGWTLGEVLYLAAPYDDWVWACVGDPLLSMPQWVQPLGDMDCSGALDYFDINAFVMEHRGEEAVLLNFWATWCAPCVEEFPLIVDLARTWQSKGLKVYFVSVDWLEQSDQVRTFLDRQDVTGTSFIKDQKDQPFIDGIAEAWTGAVPFTIVYSKRSGEVVDYWEGKAPREKFEAAIKAALID